MASRGNRWRLVALLAAAVVVPRSAHADEPTGAHAEERPVVFFLRADAPLLEGCGGADALGRAVEERLHRSVFVREDEADIEIAITIESRPNERSGHALIIERDRSGSELGRRDVPVANDDCTKSLDTLAVVLAIMVGSTRTTTEPPRHPEPARAAPPPAPRRPSTAADRAPPKPPPRPLRWQAAPLAGVVVGSGIMPGVAWGLTAGVVITPPIDRFSAIARGSYWPPQSTGTRLPANVDRIGAAILGCYELVRSPETSREALGVAACGGIDVSRLAARSADLTRPTNSSAVAGLLGEVRLGYRLPLGENLVVEPAIAVQVSFVGKRDRFTYRDVTGRELTLLQPAFVAAEAGFGVVVHFL